MNEIPFRHRNFLDIARLAVSDIEFLIYQTQLELSRDNSGTVHPDILDVSLRGKTLVNLFCENSTRTQSSFEIAAKRLHAYVVNMAPEQSSITKGETLLDTASTLNSMSPDILVVRHPSPGACLLLARKLVNCAVINAGDGAHEHPTQALLDAVVVKEMKTQIAGLEIAICGDILHSRVARSDMELFTKLGANVRLVGPLSLIPREITNKRVSCHASLEQGIEGADVVIMLRLQKERMRGLYIPSEREYFRFFGLTQERMKHAKPDAIIMHPGPINRGVEIDGELADSARSLINYQVRVGVLARMALMKALAFKLDHPHENDEIIT